MGKENRNFIELNSNVCFSESDEPQKLQRQGAMGGKPSAVIEGEGQWKADFKKSKELQAEFGKEEIYLSFKKAEAEGRVHIVGNRVVK